jgi:large subunit ribosomal protein L17
MRHRKSGRKLNRTSAHRKALGRNLIRSLFERFGSEKEYIITTRAKAKEYRPLAEKLITLGKKGTLHHRRRAFSLIQDKVTVKKLFDEIAPRYRDRPGGYTRILKTNRTRLGDGTPLVIWGLVEEGEKETKKSRKAKKAKKKSG